MCTVTYVAGWWQGAERGVKGKARVCWDNSVRRLSATLHVTRIGDLGQSQCREETSKAMHNNTPAGNAHYTSKVYSQSTEAGETKGNRTEERAKTNRNGKSNPRTRQRAASSHLLTPFPHTITTGKHHAPLEMTDYHTQRPQGTATTQQDGGQARRQRQQRAGGEPTATSHLYVSDATGRGPQTIAQHTHSPNIRRIPEHSRENETKRLWQRFCKPMTRSCGGVFN